MMNKVIQIGRLCADPEIRYTQGENASCIARYRLAVDRRFRREGEPTADFIPCVAFGKTAEFAEKYLRKGMKIAISGRIQTGSYKNQNGDTVYTIDIVVEEQEFCESKASQAQNNENNNGAYVPPAASSNDGFMNIPEGLEEELPFC